MAGHTEGQTMKVRPPWPLMLIQSGTLVSIVTGLVWFGVFRGDVKANFVNDDKQEEAIKALLQTSTNLQSAIAGLGSALSSERESARREIDQIHNRLSALENARR